MHIFLVALVFNNNIIKLIDQYFTHFLQHRDIGLPYTISISSAWRHSE